MACGDRYIELAVTESGYTPENPWGQVPILTDYAEWLRLADKLVGAVNVHAAKLQQVEAEIGTGLPEYVRLAPTWVALVRHHDKLPEFVVALNPVDPKPIKDAVAVVLEALCVLDEVDSAIAGYGARVPAVPTPGREPAPKPELPSVGNTLGTVAIVAGVLIGGWFILKKGIGD